jgi:hypothetical protein
VDLGTCGDDLADSEFLGARRNPALERCRDDDHTIAIGKVGRQSIDEPTPTDEWENEAGKGFGPVPYPFG